MACRHGGENLHRQFSAHNSNSECPDLGDEDTRLDGPVYKY